MNRARQAEITQEILEVVAGADALDTQTADLRQTSDSLRLARLASARRLSSSNGVTRRDSPLCF